MSKRLFKMIRLRHYLLLVIVVWTIGGFDLGSISISHAQSLTTSSKPASTASKAISINYNKITQGYGYTSFAATNNNYLEPRHNGVDIAGHSGDPILALHSGLVLYTGDQDNYCYGKAYGKFVVVDDADGAHELLYAHLSQINVNKDDEINAGDVLGLMGRTGYATGPHLHLSVFLKNGFQIATDKHCGPKPEGKDVNPLDYLNT